VARGWTSSGLLGVDVTVAHTFCSSCILQLAKTPDPRCPSCREVPRFDIGVLRTNTALVDLMESLVEQAKAKKDTVDATTGAGAFPAGAGQGPCSSCEKPAAASIYCADCEQDFCASCSASEHKNPKRRDHVLGPLSAKAALAAIASRCAEHADPLKLFCCAPCKQPICLVCERGLKHAGHKISPIGEVAREARHALGASIEQARLLVGQLDAETKRVAGILDQETERAREAERQIVADEERTIAAARERSRVLKAELDVATRRLRQPAESVYQAIQTSLSQAAGVSVESQRALKQGDLGVVRAVAGVETGLASARDSAAASLANKVSFSGAAATSG